MIKILEIEIINKEQPLQQMVALYHVWGGIFEL
jgi:hypothetical protein